MMHQSADAGSSDSVLVVTAERYSVDIDSNVHLQKIRLGINFLVIYFQAMSILIFSEINSNCKVKLNIFVNVHEGRKLLYAVAGKVPPFSTSETAKHIVPVHRCY